MTTFALPRPYFIMPRIKQDQSDRPPFASWLRQARQRRGVTQDDVADATGIDQGVISKYERGVLSPPKPDTVWSLAKALTPESSTEEYTEDLYREGVRLAFELDGPRKNAGDLDPDAQKILEAYLHASPDEKAAFDALAKVARKRQNEGISK